MSTYQNGAGTRTQILNAAEELFYKKGFHETSYEEICQKSHVSRRTAYYHFKDKDLLRYEVHWEWVIRMRHLAKRYCEREEYTFTLAMYLCWDKMLKDEKYRKFCLNYYEDYPVYDPNTGMGRFFLTVSKEMYGHIWPVEQIPTVAFASVYGFMAGMFQIMAAHPEAFNAKELLHNSVFWGTGIWEIPRETMEQFWDELLVYIDRFPENLSDDILFYEPERQ